MNDRATAGPSGPAFNRYWASPVEFRAFFARGYEAFRAELRARVRARDPRPDNADFMERSRYSMSDNIDSARWDGWQRLRQPSYYAFDKKLRDDERANWRNVDLELQIFAGRMMAYFDSLEVLFFVHNALRYKAEQDELVARGVSRAKWPTSGHNSGHAFDLVHGRYGWDLTEREWRAVGKIGKEIWAKQQSEVPAEARMDIVWGGDWQRLWDPAHWEIANYRSRQLPADVLESLQAFEPIRRTRKALFDLGRNRIERAREAFDYQEDGKAKFEAWKARVASRGNR